ncbi:IclR family transcriptional regulator [Mesorhizobium sp. M0088]|uniref:IclR family transcriptional regulator n=1 Tax=Mesorhizobium sp. M0088 TaxID=2956873 RepID=UPI00333BE323
MKRQIDKSETEEVKGAQLLDRSVALLKYLAEVGEEGARVHEMAKAFGLTMSTTHRIVSALERHLLLERDPSTRRYRLGLLLHTLGAKAVESTSLRRCCRPALLRLAAKTGNSVSLVARSGFHSVCLDRQEGAYPIDSVARYACSRVPLGVGSASLAILAFLPPEEANGIISADAHLYHGFNGRSAEEIRHQLPGIRKVGYALDQGHLVTGISSLALPIRPPGRDVVGALAIKATIAQMPQERIPKLLRWMRREIQTIQQTVISARPKEQ